MSEREDDATARAAASQDALGRYRVRMNRQRRIYYPVVGVLVAALIAAFTVAYLHGEAHNTRLITVASAPRAEPITAPATDQHETWHTAAHAALGTPIYGGTAVLWNKRTVYGVDARTGARTWSYYRSDRTVCAAAQLNGIAVAIYELAGNCDEITALNAGTGARSWTRTLDFNGQPLFGHPSYQVDAADETLMITSPTVIYAIAVGQGQYNNGEDWFIYSHFGCRIENAALGSAGALISQNCSHPRCGSLHLCGRGTQLLLRGDPQQDVNSNSTKNPNRITWNNLGDSDVPVSAGSLIAAGNTTTGQLDLLDSTSGKPSGSVRLGAGGPSWTSAAALPLPGGGILLSAGDTTSYVRAGDSEPGWSVGTTGPATISDSHAVVPSTGGVRLVDLNTGRVQRRFSLPSARTVGSTIYRLGTGFLVAGTSGTQAYR